MPERYSDYGVFIQYRSQNRRGGATGPKGIDWGNKEVIIYGEKGKKERRVYLTDDCAYHLQKYLSTREDNNPALFVSNKQPHTRLGKQAIQSMLRTLGNKTEIHAHPHKFRRTFIDRCRQQRNPFTGNSNVCRTSKTGYNDDVRNSQ